MARLTIIIIISLFQEDNIFGTNASPRIVTECVITRSMLIKMYVYAIYS